MKVRVDPTIHHETNDYWYLFSYFENSVKQLLSPFYYYGPEEEYPLGRESHCISCLVLAAADPLLTSTLLLPIQAHAANGICEICPDNFHKEDKI